MTQPVRVDLDDRFFADPDELYRRLRTESPVVRVLMPTGVDAWMVTRYEDVRPALNDPRLSKDGVRFREILQRRSAGQRAAFADSATHHMLNSDPPDHTRLRKLVNKAFTVRSVGRLRPRVDAIAAELADAMAAKQGRGEAVDLIDDFAFPLPMTVICELLGVPEGERDDFRGWSNTLLSAAPQHVRAAAMASMHEFLTQLVADKAAQPGDDVLSAIVLAGEDGDSLTPAEVTSMAFLLLVAGHETTVNLIGNGILALLRHPDQQALLRADPTLVGDAVEEVLRYDGPVNLATLRFTTEPVELGDTLIPADEVVFLSLVSANRDAERFADPTRFEITGDPSGHVAFGYGVHHCLGAPLARLEGEVAFLTLLDRFPSLALAAEPETLTWRESTLVHGLTHLPVTL